MYEIYQRLLDEKGLKNSDIAKATGISNMTLSDWKRGKSTPKQDKLKLIADYFGVSVDYLITGAEPDAVENVVAEHIELITTFDKLAKEQQESIMNMMKLFIKENNK